MKEKIIRTKYLVNSNLFPLEPFPSSAVAVPAVTEEQEETVIGCGK